MLFMSHCRYGDKGGGFTAVIKLQAVTIVIVYKRCMVAKIFRIRIEVTFGLRFCSAGNDVFRGYSDIILLIVFLVKNK